MATVFEFKERSSLDTPLLLFDCEIVGGRTEHWSTHSISLQGTKYDARVLDHNISEIQISSDGGVDSIPRISITLANADSHLSEIERSVGWKGSRLAVWFVFFDLRAGQPATNAIILFRGLVNPPEDISESTFRLSAINRLGMQRVMMPDVRIQRRCPWDFPATFDQRQEAATGGTKGRYSRFFRCGYSPDIQGGAGHLDGTEPFISCARTRADCEARGMFREAARFGGVEFVPSTIVVRSYGERTSHISSPIDNQARYNDFVPLVYGTAWYAPPIVFARNDGNLTHMEVLLGLGEISGVLKVIVNDSEIPAASQGSNMTATGWYNLVSTGNRTGGFNLDFLDGKGEPLGDPYGSMAYLSVVVPNRISDGRSLPSIKVLLNGLKLPTYAEDGSATADQFTNNPVWILLDLLHRCGWSDDEIDLSSFAIAAKYCDETIQAIDLHGALVQTPRFQCNVVVQRRRSAGDLIRGIRNSARVMLVYGDGGLLQARIENSLARQQPLKPDGSNSTEPLNGGWPSYEFGDGSNGTSGILRKASGEPALRFWSRSTADTPNHLTVEFQDSFNEYQQDSYSLVDLDDVARAGQEITSALTALGIPHYDQAARLLKLNLDKAIQGNVYVTFDTSVRAFGLRPGDLIALTYLKEGLQRQLFRIIKLAPSLNFQTVTITAQLHNDNWYEDSNGQKDGGYGSRQPYAGFGVPRPLLGKTRDENNDVQFEITEIIHDGTDGTQLLDLSVGFLVPAAPELGAPDIPLLGLAPVIGSNGSIKADTNLYYAISAVDSSGRESALSFTVRANLPPGPDSYSVTLTGLSFGAGSNKFHVYRGDNPIQLYRIASDQDLAPQFSDVGLNSEVLSPADPNYDHANFYWRMELQPEYPATIHSASTIGNTALQMSDDQYRDMVVRITRGAGRGQERVIVSNTATTIAVQSGWDVEPGPESYFVVAEPGWHFGATGKTSPVQFEIPNRTGNIVQISGRAANIVDAEAPAELSTVTRWLIGGAGISDHGAPPKPTFGIVLSPVRGGAVELNAVSFGEMTNTRTILAGTLILHYWNELGGATDSQLASDLESTSDLLAMTTPGQAERESYIQIGTEILQIKDVLDAGSQYRVSRGVHNSIAQAHAMGTPIYELIQKVVVVPFARDFFGSPFSGSWSYPIFIPDSRLASAEFFVTNGKGNSDRASLCLTQNVDQGLRTGSGGQFSIQVDGFLTVDNAVAPDVLVDAPHSIRDVFAVVKRAPVGAPIELQVIRNNAAYCSLTIADGTTNSNTVSGFGLPPLNVGDRLNVGISSVGQQVPGGDLTVLIRL